ncbi:integral membrane protein GPR137B-like [Anneissia japonica]|uniref:integral membrane protein GPR137B-like n=1 Tax=Anneissia japonica TaxID=1529436 RepID=UPI0014256DB3|nr:integral membrane protein GPR137B-like [Anneissia japonica]
MKTRTMSDLTEEVGSSSTPPPVPSITGPTTGPAVIPPSVKISLTITFIALYSILFLIVYVQLFLILYYRHKRKSYQTVFLFLCLIWAALRTTLFSFYIKNCELANNLKTFPYFLLYCFPVCLQFTTLCLLVVYFGQVVFKAKVRYEPEKYKRKQRLLRTCIAFLVVTFFFVNLSAVLLIKKYSSHKIEIVHVRVIISGILFFTGGIALSICIWKLARMTSANVLLEARGTTVCQATTACVVITFLYLTRTVYNIVAVACNNDKDSFGYSWLNVSDQADYLNLKGYRYITFGGILFLWEFLPTFIVVMFFRVRRYASRLNAPEVKNVNRTPSKAYFFDNPRRYDSEDDLCRTYSANAGPTDFTPDMNSPCTPINGTPQLGYGTIIRSSSYSSGGQYIMPGTTPPLLFSSKVSIGGYQQIYD